MIETFYNYKMSPKERVGFSRSPQKSRLIIEHLSHKNLLQYFPFAREWKPFNKTDFYIAHEKKYVDDFFSGTEPLCSSNGLQWNEDFADSVRYTNSSLYHAIKKSYKSKSITFSPTSGFHHATPKSGRAFCTFSGQVIASMKLWNRYKISGAYIDLDGHFGNSIEDSKYFIPNLEKAIPFNINPIGKGEGYIRDAKGKLDQVLNAITLDKVHYIVLCSGADSLVDDDLGGQLTYEEWYSLKDYVHSTLAKLDHGDRKFPTTITLFGGYREDDYDSVLDAHARDLWSCLRHRFDLKDEFKSVYRQKDVSK